MSEDKDPRQGENTGVPQSDVEKAVLPQEDMKKAHVVPPHNIAPEEPAAPEPAPSDSDGGDSSADGGSEPGEGGGEKSGD